MSEPKMRFWKKFPCFVVLAVWDDIGDISAGDSNAHPVAVLLVRPTQKQADEMVVAWANRDDERANACHWFAEISESTLWQPEGGL